MDRREALDWIDERIGELCQAALTEGGLDFVVEIQDVLKPAFDARAHLARGAELSDDTRAHVLECFGAARLLILKARND